MKAPYYLTLLLLSFINYAQPPEPPVGKRWVVNEQYSDEFNGNKLDASKWYDYHPTWKGRAPGLFMPSQVSVGDGYMMIQGKKMAKDTIVNGQTFNISGGAVISKNKEAYFGYYECKFKAAKTTMSTTFWFSTGKSFKGDLPCGDNYGLELDIQECIGRVGDFKGDHFANGMNSNGHYWYTGCDKKKQDLRAPQVKFRSDKLASEDFNVYGGWWKDENQVSFYYNNDAPKHMNFNSTIKEKSFDKPMQMNMVSETYPYPWIELPNDAELADPSKNTCYYDWVRSYILVDVDSDYLDPFLNKKGSKTAIKKDFFMFSEAIRFIEKPMHIKNAKSIFFPIDFKAKTDREIHLAVKNSANKVIENKVFPAYAGFGRKDVELALGTHFQSNESYTVQIFIRPLKAANDKDAFQSDAFIFKLN
ncbi:hypothetical protein FFWV33_15300 [Flavobacterium faecale]|uniref:GH16 domain-containing protein n=1 Tax=Flavobacterium faecale TaxID=1355330 RepID=A0A2S1LGD6_9FLAO|nr:beta-porphyranase D [Flavobacterium faecale]AWG22797.1 hypothetical protein FFWV33_15300 [Flavobacterium faecale]